MGETFKIGSVNLVRQGTISLIAILLNNTLYFYGSQTGGIGGEVAISVYGLATRMAMFALFPLIGIAQGFMPIAGYNYGANHFERVKSVINVSLIGGFVVSVIITAILLLSSNYIPYLFTKDPALIEHGPHSYILDILLYSYPCFFTNSSILFSSHWKSFTCFTINLD